MSEFDPPQKPFNPEAHLLARLQLQRVIFGACALVLVIFFSLGLSAYRQMDRDRAAAERAAETADDVATDRAAYARGLEHDLDAMRGTLESTRATLAAEKSRLAAADLAAGNHARARALLHEARMLGAPPWAEFLSRLLDDPNPPRFNSDRAGMPVVAGAVAASHGRIAIVRALPDGGILEVFDPATGRLLGASALPAGGEGTTVKLNRAGTRCVVLVGGVCLHGDPLGALVPLFDTDFDMDQRASLYASADLEVVAVVQAGRVVAQSGDASVQTQPGEGVVALAFMGRAPAALLDSDVVVIGSQRVALESGLEAAPDNVAIHAEAGVVRVALQAGSALELHVLHADQSLPPARRDVPLAQSGWHSLRFNPDGSLLCLGAGGSAVMVDADGPQPLQLGDHAASFAAFGPQGIVFGNLRGELSVRMLDSVMRTGRPLFEVPDGYTARALNTGFVLTSPSGSSHVLHAGRWYDAGKLTRLAPAPGGFAGADGDEILLPWGGATTVRESGLLLGAFADGTLLFVKPPNTFVFLGRSSRVEQFATLATAPQDVALASGARAAALRYRDTVYFTDMDESPHPRAVATTQGVEADMLALSHDGGRLAIVLGSTVRVVSTRDNGPERALRLSDAPAAVALVFGGTLLAAAEGDALRFYEVATGRLLWQGELAVQQLATSGDTSLRLTSGPRAYALRLSQG